MSSAVPTETKEVKTNLEPGIADILLRSRKTILDILEARGYDVSAYRNIVPSQILTLAESNSRALDIFVPKKEDSKAPCDRAVVVHLLNDRIKNRLGTFRRDLYDVPADPTGANKIEKADDVIVLVNEPYSDDFDKTSLYMWQQEKARIVFFHIKSVVVNPADHVLVPRHRKLTAEEAKAEMDRLHVTTKLQLPTIKHFDIQSRVLGLVPGDIVEIMRPSPTAGVARVLRACTA
jgi:DNA-directed RNA polymerase subunit H (RpoH/RPB5)